MKKRKIMQFAIGNIWTDARVRKVARYLTRQGHDVSYLTGFHLAGPTLIGEFAHRLDNCPLWVINSQLTSIEDLRLLLETFIKSERPEIIWCHELTALWALMGHPTEWEAQRPDYLCDIKIVYDAHELEYARFFGDASERDQADHRLRERLAIEHVDVLVTPGKELTYAYLKQYPFTHHTWYDIYNAPETLDSVNNKSDSDVIAYVGNIATVREVVELGAIASKHHKYVRYQGTDRLQSIERYYLQSLGHIFLQPTSFFMVPECIMHCRVGFAGLDMTVAESYRLSAATKILEYVQAGLPVIARRNWYTDYLQARGVQIATYETFEELGALIDAPLPYQTEDVRRAHSYDAMNSDAISDIVR